MPQIPTTHAVLTRRSGRVFNARPRRARRLTERSDSQYREVGSWVVRSRGSCPTAGRARHAGADLADVDRAAATGWRATWSSPRARRGPWTPSGWAPRCRAPSRSTRCSRPRPRSSTAPWSSGSWSPACCCSPAGAHTGCSRPAARRIGRGPVRGGRGRGVEPVRRGAARARPVGAAGRVRRAAGGCCPAVRRVLAAERHAWFVVVAAAWLGSLTPDRRRRAACWSPRPASWWRSCGARPGAPRGCSLVTAGCPAAVGAGRAPRYGAPPRATPAASTAFAARAERAGGVLADPASGRAGCGARSRCPARWRPGRVTVLTVVVVVVAAGRRRPAGGPARAGPGGGRGGRASSSPALAHLPGGADASAGRSHTCPAPGCSATARSGCCRTGRRRRRGRVADRAGRGRLRRRDADLGRLLAGGARARPVVLMPDAAGRTWEALEPGDLPGRARRGGGGPRRRATAPATWSRCRGRRTARFAWGNPVSAADPLPRWTRRPRRVRHAGGRRRRRGGRGPRAQRGRRGRRRARRTAGRAAARDSASAGRWSTATSRGPPTSTRPGSTLVVEGPDVALYRVPVRRPRRARTVGARRGRGRGRLVGLAVARCSGRCRGWRAAGARSD